jgi:hypothetical protein
MKDKVMETQNNPTGLEKAMEDFKQHLPEPSTCTDDVITEIIIVGSSKARLQANRIRNGNMYLWNIQSTTAYN